MAEKKMNSRELQAPETQKKINSRKRQALETQMKIQQAAFRLFEERGFDHVSMDQIAEETGCSVGNVYYHFRTKENILSHLTDHIDAMYEEIEAEYLAHPGVPSDERLLDFAGRALAASVSELLVYESMAYAIRKPDARIMDPGKERPFYRLLRHLIAECRAEGTLPAEMRERDLLREYLMLHRGILVEWQAEQQQFDLVTAGRTLVRRWMNGF